MNVDNIDAKLLKERTSVLSAADKAAVRRSTSEPPAVVNWPIQPPVLLSHAGTPAEQSDKGRIVQIMV